MSDSAKTGIQVEPVGKMSCGECGTEYDVSPFEPFSVVQCPGCSVRQTVPAKLGHFVLLRLIGTGGMGGVYHARDETLGRDVAIKVMLKSLGDDAQFVETFRREAQAAAKLNHPSIAQIYSFGQSQGQPYIVMELVSHGSLAKRMEKSNRLDQSFVIDVGLKIAEGLQAADAIGLMHGDIKPENILMDERDNAKLVDFGLASYVDQAAADGIWGTPYYIAPEKIRRQKADARSDIYSLGGTLYHAIAGQPPFDGKTPIEVIQARLDAQPPELATLVEGVDKTVSDIIMRMLEEKPPRRYPTYMSLLSDMRKAVAALPKPAGKRAVTKRLRPAGKGRRLVTKKRTTGLISTTGADDDRPSTTKLRIDKTSTTTESALSEYRHMQTESPEQIAQRRKKTGTIIAVIFSVIVLLGMAAGGWWLWNQHSIRIEIERLKYALRKKCEEARELTAETCATTTNITRIVDAGRAIVAPATNAVAETLQAAMTRPSPTDEQKDDYAALRKLDDVIVAAHKGFAREEEKVTKIRDTADKTLSAVEEATKVDIAEKRLKSVGQVHELKARLLQAVEERLKNVTKLHELTAKAETEIKGERAEIERTAAEIEKLRKKIDAGWKRIQEERAAAEAAKEEAERRKQEEAERAARARKEVGMAKTAHEAQAVSRDTYRYSKAVDDLTTQLRDFRTEEGKQAMQILIDRFQRLADLKKAIIRKLAAQPYKWGWISSRSPTDVLGADDNGVRLKGQAVPWDKVNARQMLHFVKYLLGDREVPLPQRGELHLSAAVFCREHGGEELAKQYADKAASMTPRLEVEIERLLPPLPPAEE